MTEKEKAFIGAENLLKDAEKEVLKEEELEKVSGGSGAFFDKKPEALDTLKDNNYKTRAIF